MYHAESGVFCLDHCWPIVKDAIKFRILRDTPPSDTTSPTIPVNLEDDDRLEVESVPKTRNYRPRLKGRLRKRLNIKIKNTVIIVL